MIRRLLIGVAAAGVLVALALLTANLIAAKHQRRAVAVAMGRQAAASPPPRPAAPRVAAVSRFPLRYANPAPVPGSLAPRAEASTSVTRTSDGRWQVSIDGTNDYGRRRAATGHHTGIVLRPGGVAHIRHLSGALAYNALGDRVAICGIGRTAHPWERRPLPDLPIYAIAAGYRAGEKFHWAVPSCFTREVTIRNNVGRDVELVLIFNLNSHYRTPDGQSHEDGFAYAGWDGGWALFEVRLRPGS